MADKYKKDVEFTGNQRYVKQNNALFSCPSY